MNILKLKPQKDVPAEKKVRRGRIAAVCLAAAILVIIVIPNKKAPVTDNRGSVKAAMDSALDSLVASAGFGDYELTYKGRTDMLPVERVSPKNEELDSIQNAIHVITESRKLSDDAKLKQLKSLVERKSQLLKEIDEYEQGSADKYYHSRRIKFRTSEGRTFTFFQDAYDNGSVMEMSYLKELTSKNPEKEFENLKKK